MLHTIQCLDFLNLDQSELPRRRGRPKGSRDRKPRARAPCLSAVYPFLRVIPNEQRTSAHPGFATFFPRGMEEVTDTDASMLGDAADKAHTIHMGPGGSRWDLVSECHALVPDDAQPVHPCRRLIDPAVAPWTEREMSLQPAGRPASSPAANDPAERATDPFHADWPFW